MSEEIDLTTEPLIVEAPRNVPPAKTPKHEFNLMGEKLEEVDAPTQLTERDLLDFAKLILGNLFFLYLVIAVIHIYSDSKNSAEVFKVVSNLVPSFATLIIGFYFGKKS